MVDDDRRLAGGGGIDANQKPDRPGEVHTNRSFGNTFLEGDQVGTKTNLDWSLSEDGCMG